MELRQVRFFVAVAEERHFGRAAERMYIAQPALSQHIRRLERELGVRLFDRSSRHVRLTPAGTVFLRGARRLLATADETMRDAVRADEGQLGTISIAVDLAAAGDVLAAALGRWAALRPSVRPSLVAGRRPELLDLARRHDVDVVLVEGPVSDGRLHADVLVEHDTVVLVPAAHRLAAQSSVAFDELRDENFVVIERAVAPGLHDRTIAECDAAGFSPRVQLQVGEPGLVQQVVAAGSCVAVVGTNHVASGTAPGVEVRPLRASEALTSLVVVWDRDHATAQSAEFVRLLVDVTRTSRVRSHGPIGVVA
jgi:DNA-binding transcriptional LysR family regulator